MKWITDIFKKEPATLDAGRVARLVLTDQQFGELVRGKVVTKLAPPNGAMVQIVMQDVGYHRMLEHVSAAIANHEEQHEEQEVPT